MLRNTCTMYKFYKIIEWMRGEERQDGPNNNTSNYCQLFKKKKIIFFVVVVIVTTFKIVKDIDETS